MVAKEFQLECLAPDAPHMSQEDARMNSWWNRKGNDYIGLEQTLELIQTLSQEREIVGIFGFSQGARLSHLLSLLHSADSSTYLPHLKFVMICAGYDARCDALMPSNFPISVPQTVSDDALISLPSLHIFGRNDKLIFPEQSQAVAKEYVSGTLHSHEGNHFVPNKAADLEVYQNFIQQSLLAGISSFFSNLPEPEQEEERLVKAQTIDDDDDDVFQVDPNYTPPDEDQALAQQDEVIVLESMYPNEISMISGREDEDAFEHPIRYRLELVPTSDDTENTQWPPKPLSLIIQYPNNYPTSSIPIFKLKHGNTVMEFPSSRAAGLLRVLQDTATQELETEMASMPLCIAAATEFLDTPPPAEEPQPEEESMDQGVEEEDEESSHIIPPSSPEDIAAANLQGLAIARKVLAKQNAALGKPGQNIPNFGNSTKGGSLQYTIGLVGKPSAGKSTFFNAATAFSRQRNSGDKDSNTFGASMAAHPFTTIDPNVGYCLVPAPVGSCPEDSLDSGTNEFGSTHGRDPNGRRFLPVLLKDVAGLVPGAYKGKGRGNQFLNDLTDANILIEVVDASGTADAQGNQTNFEQDDCDNDTTVLTNPLDDLAWILNELVEWIYSNLLSKWESIQRRGRSRLTDMFSGYGQTQATTLDILEEVEKYLREKCHRDHALNKLQEWDSADVHRLVSAFLGVRFPIALALNKCDIASSKDNLERIQEALPIHGAHVATPIVAKHEMNFMYSILKPEKEGQSHDRVSKVPRGVWDCLTSALALREPILIFPVEDLKTYKPLPGLNKHAAESPSLPSEGMLTCIDAAGGYLPCSWDPSKRIYATSTSGGKKGSSTSASHNDHDKLRDVLLMKPGSTVEDVFNTLKKLGALGGEFIRCEGQAEIGEPSKPIAKFDLVGKHNRILKIMSSKRSSWQ